MSGRSRKPWCQTSGLCLSALVLAVGLLPPGLRHHHEDGDRPHSHRATPMASDQPSLRESRPALVAAVIRSVPGEAPRESIAHVHFDCFFFTVTLPDPAAEPTSRDVAGCCELIVLVQAAVMPTQPVGGQWLTPAGVAPGALVAADPTPRIAMVANQRVPHHLCDAARHERSGVQLA